MPKVPVAAATAHLAMPVTVPQRPEPKVVPVTVPKALSVPLVRAAVVTVQLATPVTELQPLGPKVAPVTAATVP